MCNHLRLEKLADKVHYGGHIGVADLVGLDPDKTNGTFKLSGFSRIDGSRDGKRSFADQWPAKNWRLILINATEFGERHKKTGETVTFRLDGKKIAAITNEDRVRILTRASRTPEEKAIHGRMPVQVPDTMGRDGFVEYVNDKLGTDYK